MFRSTHTHRSHNPFQRASTSTTPPHQQPLHISNTSGARSFSRPVHPQSAAARHAGEHRGWGDASRTPRPHNTPRSLGHARGLVSLACERGELGRLTHAACASRSATLRALLTRGAAHPTCEQGYTDEELAELEEYEQGEEAAGGEDEEEEEEAEEEVEEERAEGGRIGAGARRQAQRRVVNDSDVSDADLNDEDENDDDEQESTSGDNTQSYNDRVLELCDRVKLLLDVFLVLTDDSGERLSKEQLLERFSNVKYTNEVGDECSFFEMLSRALASGSVLTINASNTFAIRMTKWAASMCGVASIQSSMSSFPKRFCTKNTCTTAMEMMMD